VREIFSHISNKATDGLTIRMKTATTVCGRCGAKISGGVTREGCPACLLETGLGLLEDESDPGRDDGVPTADRKKTTQAAGMLVDFGDYELLEEIGRGGQGIVYRAHQKSLNRTVALKIIGLGPWTTEAHLKRFRREAEAAASLDHPCIVPIYEVSEREGQCYFSMKFVEGGQLDEVVRCAPISIPRAVELIAKLARTVHYAHEHGILHRDIKPGNILLDAKGEPLLTDFGLARLVEAESTVTRTLEVIGTPSYMAPEQAAGEHTQVGSATDVYGLGAVLYQLLTGHPPFAGRTSYETIRLLLDTEPRQPRLWNPKIARELSTICLKCLEKEPKRRYPSALALAEDLEHWLKHEPIRAHRTGIFTRGQKWMRRKPAIAALIASLIALAAAIGWNVWKSELISHPAPKSVAVLPFSNLSKEGENAFFTDGVQDEILTNLARIADLKVISRASTMQYKSGVARNLRKIGRQLGVAHLVEGSVQRSGNRVRVNAQLIDARSERQLWGQSYDRDLADVFAIESEIAEQIVSELKSKLSPQEKAAIDVRPTRDLEAFDLYLQAKQLINRFDQTPDWKETLLKALRLLDEAISRDVNFTLAYCWAAQANVALYWFGFDHTPGRLAQARTMAQKALALAPESGEAHLAQALVYYEGDRDYARARAELAIARKMLPNSADVYSFTGWIDRRQGRWEDAVKNQEKAAELDPRNPQILGELATSFDMLRRYDDEESVFDRAIAANPDSTAYYQILRAAVELEKGNTKAARNLLDPLPSGYDPDGAATSTRINLELYERDAASAAKILAASKLEELVDSIGSLLPRDWFQALVARASGDAPKARDAFSAARAKTEAKLQDRPADGDLLAFLGLIDAGLARKKEALAEGRRAVELQPISEDAVDGARVITKLAMIYTWLGDNDAAIERLTFLAKTPAGPDYGQLKLDPAWDGLRGDARFARIVDDLKPRSARQ
jgi:serine/threonine protein kinase/tetratricopeptide (TPR) repeat protein